MKKEGSSSLLLLASRLNLVYGGFFDILKITSSPHKKGPRALKIPFSPFSLPFYFSLLLVGARQQQKRRHHGIRRKVRG